MDEQKYFVIDPLDDPVTHDIPEPLKELAELRLRVETQAKRIAELEKENRKQAMRLTENDNFIRALKTDLQTAQDVRDSYYREKGILREQVRKLEAQLTKQSASEPVDPLFAEYETDRKHGTDEYGYPDFEQWKRLKSESKSLGEAYNLLKKQHPTVMLDPNCETCQRKAELFNRLSEIDILLGY